MTRSPLPLVSRPLRVAAALLLLPASLGLSACVPGLTTATDPATTSAGTGQSAPLTRPTVAAAAASPTASARSGGMGTIGSKAGSQSGGTGSTASAQPGGKDTAQGTDGAAVWGFPMLADGWTLAVWDQDGVNQLVKSNGCQFTSRQNLFEASSSGDKAESEAYANALGPSLTKQGAGSMQTSVSTDSTSVAQAGGGGTVTLTRVDLSYTGTDGEAYKGVHWFRAFTTASTPTMLQLSYYCPASAYSDADLATLLKDTSVVNASPASM